MKTTHKKRASGLLALTAGFLLVGTVRQAGAEPMFLSKQYPRCTSCHYSATGGGLLTSYGRALSRQELSTTGREATLPAGAEIADLAHREEAFLFGLLGDALGPVQLGFDVRPSRLQFSFAGVDSSRNLLMTADLLAAYQMKGWTFYGEIGREPQSDGWKIDSYEYWVSRQAANGIAVRAGRFLPAYGIRFADHTAFSRQYLGFDKYDQIYGLEVTQARDRSLLQVSVSPGLADAIIGDTGRQAFTATGRFQFDLSPRTVVVASGFYRGASDLGARGGATGVAFGFAPTPRLNVWTEADTQFRQGLSGPPGYIVVNETSFEAVRGLWLKVSPQIRTVTGNSSAGAVRMAFEIDFLPRTHWNIDLSFYRDWVRPNDLVISTFLAQLHLYL